MRVRAVVFALAATIGLAALTVPSASLAASRTTQPTKYRKLVVILSDQGIKMGFYGFTHTHEGWVPVPSYIPRGDYLSFQIVNVGKKPHNFTAFGKTTSVLKHGKIAHLFLAVMVRGKYPVGSTLDKSKNFHGYIYVV